MAKATFTGPAAAGIITPAQQKMALSSNYLDFRSNDVFGDSTNISGWAQQYLPDLYEQEVDRYGNRTISGFLAMLSAEIPMQSDQVVWSEQGRLHLAYTGEINPTNGTIDLIKNIDTAAKEQHAVRPNSTVVAIVNDIVFKAIVTSTTTNTTDSDLSTVVIRPYTAEHVDDIAGIAATDNQAIKFFVYGSEYAKGTDSPGESIEANFTSFSNRPMIIKDEFEVSGSDTAQIGWVEVTGESGQGGYLWYLKSAGDTRSRFNDYLEMSMVEAEKAAGTNVFSSVTNAPQGTEGLFAAIENRGIVATDVVDSASDALADFDLLLAELDKQGAIEENMLYLDRASNLVFDDMLGQISVGNQGGTAYGVFENSEDMALNLGFTGFRRGSYDFYKTDWKYLNDASTRGHITKANGDGEIKGVLIPAGTSSVYDENLGKNMKRPFLHVRYRASELESRENKSWTTGSVGATTSDLDAMEMHFLSERCMVVQGADNFMLMN